MRAHGWGRILNWVEMPGWLKARDRDRHRKATPAFPKTPNGSPWPAMVPAGLPLVQKFAAADDGC